MMATESMIAVACRTDEEIARGRMGPSPLADTRGIVGGFDDELDPLMQRRAARWLRRRTPRDWRLLLDVLGLDDGGPLTAWPGADADRETLVVCLAEVRIHEAGLVPDEDDEPDEEPPTAVVPRPDRAWMDQAVCRTVDEEVFFPHDTDEVGIAAAKSVCGGCRVRPDCLEYAVDTLQKDGVWGGTTPNERRSVRRRRARLAAVVEVVPEAERVVVREKPCGSCGVIQPAAEFGEDKFQKDGLNKRCKGCTNEDARRRRREAKQAVA